MAFIKTNQSLVGKRVKLTERIEAIKGYFEVDSIVTITGVNQYRGYSFTDDEGNTLIECGWGGFVLLED